MKKVRKQFTMFLATNLSRGHLHNYRKKQAGFSLIEVMVAALILSTALLGVVGLQMISMKGEQQSTMKQHASAAVHNMIERMRSNRPGVIAKDYVVDTATFSCAVANPNCRMTNCSSSDMALLDKKVVICGDQESGSNDINGIVKRRASEHAPIVTDGTFKIECMPADASKNILANCLSGDVLISLGWTERAFGKETVAKPDSIIIQTRIGL